MDALCPCVPLFVFLLVSVLVLSIVSLCVHVVCPCCVYARVLLLCAMCVCVVPVLSVCVSRMALCSPSLCRLCCSLGTVLMTTPSMQEDKETRSSDYAYIEERAAHKDTQHVTTQHTTHSKAKQHEHASQQLTPSTATAWPCEYRALDSHVAAVPVFLSFVLCVLVCLCVCALCACVCCFVFALLASSFAIVFGARTLSSLYTVFHMENAQIGMAQKEDIPRHTQTQTHTHTHTHNKHSNTHKQQQHRSEPTHAQATRTRKQQGQTHVTTQEHIMHTTRVIQCTLALCMVCCRLFVSLYCFVWAVLMCCVLYVCMFACLCMSVCVLCCCVVVVLSRVCSVFRVSPVCVSSFLSWHAASRHSHQPVRRPGM